MEAAIEAGSTQTVATRLMAAGALLDRVLERPDEANHDEVAVVRALRGHVGQLAVRMGQAGEAAEGVMGEAEELREELADVAELWQGVEDAGWLAEAIELLGPEIQKEIRPASPGESATGPPKSTPPS